MPRTVARLNSIGLFASPVISIVIMSTALKLSATLAVLCLAALGNAQEVQIAPVKGGVMLSVSAEHSYQLMPGETKLPVLGVECIHKGKKSSHLVIFSPGGSVVGGDDDAGAKGGQAFLITIDGKKRSSSWTRYGDAESYANVARTEQERLQFLQSLLGSMVSIEFKPFLTGTPTTATFDLSKLREAMNKQSECSGD